MIMKHWIHIVKTVAIILAIFFSVAYVCMALKGKAVVVKQLEDLTHKKVNVGLFDLTLPLRLELKNVEIEGLAKIERVYISPSLLYFLTGRIALNEVRIIRPEFTLERFADEKSQKAAPKTEEATQPEPAAPVEPAPAAGVTPQPETTAPQAETAPKIEPAPPTEVTPKTEAAPPAEEVSKTQEATQPEPAAPIVPAVTPQPDC